MIILNYGVQSMHIQTENITLCSRCTMMSGHITDPKYRGKSRSVQSSTRITGVNGVLQWEQGPQAHPEDSTFQGLYSMSQNHRV